MRAERRKLGERDEKELQQLNKREDLYIEE